MRNIEENFKKVRAMFGMTCWERSVGLSVIEAVHSVRGIVIIQRFQDKKDGLIGFQVYLPASTDNQVDSEVSAIEKFLDESGQPWRKKGG